MTFADGTPKFAFTQSYAGLGLAFLLVAHIVTCCLSLIYVADFYVGLQVVMFDKTCL
jgi:hypothetical protein